MRTTHRDYAEEAGDFGRLARLLTDDSDHVRTHTTWCLGRLSDWRYGLWGDKPSIPRFCERNAHLWFDGLGDLVAAVISEEGGPQAAVLTAHGHRFLFEGALAWVLANWGGRGPLSVEVPEAAVVETAALERSEFRRASVFHAYTFDLARPLPESPPLPDGFTLVDMQSEPDYRARRLLRAPDRRLVAGCEALIDARNATADVERICTHSAFRRRGLARAAIHDCLRRLRAMGMARAFIAGYGREALALYGSLGAVEERTCLVYRQGE